MASIAVLGKNERAVKIEDDADLVTILSIEDPTLELLQLVGDQFREAVKGSNYIAVDSRVHIQQIRRPKTIEVER